MPSLSKNEICIWDFTIPEERITVDELKEKCNEWCKSWCFQKEKSEKTNYIHWQGRISLKVKTRNPPIWVQGIHWSPTSKEGQQNFYYVEKENTRIDGPYKDTDKEIFIPRQCKIDGLFTFQKEILDSINVFEPRTINLLYDPVGKKGKSTLASIMELKYGGIDLPPLNDFKEIIQIMHGICSSKNLRTVGGVFFDLPRAMDKERLYGIFCALEQIKKGKLYDMRYNYRDWWIDSPQIWVFTNYLPDLSLLSEDRWKIWEVKGNPDKKNDYKLCSFLGDAKASVILPKKLKK